MYISHNLLQIRTIAFNKLDMALGTGTLRYNHLIKHTIDRSTNTIYKFHSNAFDGYPPDHYQYSLRNDLTGRMNADMYHDALVRMHVLYDMSYNVKYMWEHEFRTAPNHNILTLLHNYSIVLYPDYTRNNK